jgi:preprotein translocase subunit SecF
MRDQSGGEVTVIRFDSVGPSIGAAVASRAAFAVAVAALAVVVYITFAFRRVPNAFRYGICAIIAMIHDVAVVFSILGWGALLFGWQIDAILAFLNGHQFLCGIRWWCSTASAKFDRCAGGL